MNNIVDKNMKAQNCQCLASSETKEAKYYSLLFFIFFLDFQ